MYSNGGRQQSQKSIFIGKHGAQVGTVAGIPGGEPSELVFGPAHSIWTGTDAGPDSGIPGGEPSELVFGSARSIWTGTIGGLPGSVPPGAV